MRKFFLIPLLTLFCSVMAFATVHTAGTYQELQDALSAAVDGDEIQLTADITGFNNTANYSALNITKSITLDGKGHTLDGFGTRDATSNKVTLAINAKVNGVAPTHDVEVVIKNIDIINRSTAGTYKARPLETRGHITSLTLDHVNILATANNNDQGLTIGGSQASPAILNIIDSKIEVGNSSYPIISYNPYIGTLTNCEIKGWSALYFKGIDGSAGSRYSSVEATNCTFWSHNVHSGVTNAFGAFVLEDDGINITLDNCQVDCTQEGDQDQAVFCLSSWATRAAYAAYYQYDLEPCQFTVRGASTEVIGNILTNKWNGTENECPITFFFYGGTYDDNIEAKIADGVPSGFHVNVLPTVKGGEPITLYRVVKDAAEKEPGVLYNLNDDVEGEGGGENPVTSFELSTGTDMTLNQETTTAGYVQITDNESTSDGTTVTVGTDTQDQTLIINDGLDVQGESQVIVQAGSTLQIGEGGITTEDPENIVIEADETGAASLLLNPDVIVNNTPNLTVRMTAKQIGKLGSDYYWHRFAMPVAAGITSWEKEGNLPGTTYPTYLYGWDYANNTWEKLQNGVADMVPLQGYTLTLASEEIDPQPATLQDVTYIFKGNLVGNTNQPLNFQAEGFNFFGNSYTGYMDVLTLIQGLESNNVEGTVYMWCNDPDDDEERYQSYEGVSLLSLQNPTLRLFLADWQKEVAPMQTFILRLRGADSANEEVNYADAIWGNPRYGNGGANPAPRRRVAEANNIESHMAIVVKTANSKGSRVEFTQDANHNDAFESGYDVVKYMNENAINLYATVEGEDLSTVVTDNIEGKTFSLQTNGEITYTMSIKNVIGDEYAIRDNATGAIIAIEEGATYEFAAQPNSLVENRFEIIAAAKVPTSIENTEVKANAKGIYTITGQFAGEDFNVLPAGVYVVDGVKIVK